MTNIFFTLTPTMHFGFSYIHLKGDNASVESVAVNWDIFHIRQKYLQVNFS